MKTYGVIMAGGGGTRFWPLSRQTMPKQLLNLSGNDILINETISRISNLISTDNIFIVTNEKQGDLLKKLVSPTINHDKILLEPSARNTAACIGYSAMEIVKKYGDGIMCVFPSDHFIKNEKEFDKVLSDAIEVANSTDKLVTIGITPTFPSTGYGYIKYDNQTSSNKECNIIEFVEKPNYLKAKDYVNSGEYLWNSGIFIWKASTILNNFQRFLPKIYSCLEYIGCKIGTNEEKESIQSIYPVIPSISIDYGILERSGDVVVLPGDFGWNDVGSWDSLGNIYDVDANGNVIKGESINFDTENCVIYSDTRLVATVGIKDLIVVETEDAVLVCSKDRAQDVKKVVDALSERGENRYLE